MKYYKSVASLIFFLLFVSFINISSEAQENQPVDWLSGYSTEIPAGSYTYRFNYEYFNKDNCGMRITSIKTDKKGQETISKMEFYLPDIDENTIQFKPTGKYLTVTMITKGSQKFIKEIENDEIKSYVSSIDIFVDEVGKAREMVDAFKQHLKECRRQEKSWNSFDESLNWLSKNITKSFRGNTEYEQTFSYDAGKPYLVSLVRKSTDNKGNEVTEEYTMNLSDIDPLKTSLNVSGKDLLVKLPVKSSDNYIAVDKNSEQQNYDDELVIYIPDIELARDVLLAFKYAIPLANPVYRAWGSVSDALAYLKSNIKEISVGNYKYDQVFEYDPAPNGAITFISSRTDSKGAVTEEKYVFYLSDIDAKIPVTVSGKDIKLILTTKDKQKLIKILKNSEQQNYDYDLTLYSDNIESAREIASAFNYTVLNRETGIIKWTDVNKAIDWISASVADATESGKIYEQNLTVDPADHYKMEYNINIKESSGDVEENFILYLADLSKDDIDLDIVGKKITVGVGTGNEKLIKATKMGVLQNFASSFDILFDDTRKAQNFANALKFLATEVKPQPVSFTDAKQVLSAMLKNLHEVSNGSDVYEQSVELVDGNYCKWKMTIKQTDSKGMETEYIYQFDLADINPEAVALQVSGKEMMVVVETKGNQKLIKPYKNNEPQNFAYEFKLYATDAWNAHWLIDAIKFAIKNC